MAAFRHSVTSGSMDVAGPSGTNATLAALDVVTKAAYEGTAGCAAVAFPGVRVRS